ncbi:hypothetical protein CK203_023888 [Vitis vinifera]|uniref:Uncharacterized protein n=1 Tax=Vitis vinifera TaxID=29760 RepID=A0A438JA48_VITVI|nr:hypothetical protein CK203_023888 [Vitis vinifera]
MNVAEMVSSVEDTSRKSSMGICRETWNRCSGYPSSHMSRRTVTTKIECELCCIAAAARRINRNSGISLAGAVHVKDVAKAQVLLFETPAASGRYLCTDGIYQFADFAERVSKLFPEFPVHRSVA